MKNFHIEAHKYIGVPFKHQGRTDRGLDCVGLVILAARDCGYDRYKEFAYGKEPDSKILLNVLREHFGQPVDRPPKVNDVLLARLHTSGMATHVGIVTTHPHGLGVIHAYGTIERVTYQLLTPKMINKIVGVYQWPERY